MEYYIAVIEAIHTHNVSKSHSYCVKEISYHLLKLVCLPPLCIHLQVCIHYVHPLYREYGEVRLPVTAAAIIFSILRACAVCPHSASWLNENSVGTIGPLIDFVSSNRQKLNPTPSFPPTHSEEGEPI